VSYPKDTLAKYGFESNDQFNAFRYTDYCFKLFMEAAKKEKYFANTIFVFVGDHGVPGNVGTLYPESFSELLLTRLHVPLLFYSPQLLQPQLVQHVCSQIDVMPSIATLLKTPYSNTSMGQSLFDSTYIYRQNAFTVDHELHTIGMANNDYYYRKNVITGKIDFASIKKGSTVPVNKETDSIKNKLGILADAYYHTSKYILYNNQKK
jgi:phosphoglycerol transferase MdoB-like AlkP superfamily enzyme